MRRSVVNSSVTGLCVTKLDVLDGLAEVKLCVEYGEDGAPRYEAMPGWQGRTAGLRSAAELPAAARAYLDAASSRSAACRSR